ncbi:MAG: hypothetical protein K2I99_09330, partial [Bacteroidaceae bacterium]|nr:hypothetical protein [Bacteroidaceae bacterium]
MFDIDLSRLIEQLLYQPDSPMIFSSGIFLFLFLGFTLIYNQLSKADTVRILFVTLFSYYFYYKSSGLFFWLLALVTVSDYCIARAIGGLEQRNRLLRKTLVFLSLLLDLGLLFFFKYTNFLGETLCTLLTDWGIHVPSVISGSYLQAVVWQPRD